MPCNTPRGALPARNPFIRTRRRRSSYARGNSLANASAGNSTRILRCTGLISSISIFITHHKRDSRFLLHSNSIRGFHLTATVTRLLIFNLTSDVIDYLWFWCERGDSNPHGYPLDPKSSASASSATLALEKFKNTSTSTSKNESRKRVMLSQVSPAQIV